MRIEFVQKIIDVIRNKKKRILKNAQNASMGDILNKIAELEYVHIPAQSTHKETFAKYKGIYRGKEIVLFGSGATIQQYTKQENAIQVGVNHTFSLDFLELDYLFVQDYLNISTDKNNNIQKLADNYRAGKCKKFYGIHFEEARIPEINALNANAERYYFIDHEVPTTRYATFSSDITTRPLNEWSSVIFAALEFILYTHPKRIYIAGCDCSSTGHIHWDDYNLSNHEENLLLYGWKTMKKFINSNYPDIEVISINPVGLKGMFKDVYTRKYVDAHPELLKENVEIID